MAFENPRHLVALPTKAGVEAKLEIVEAFIADVPIRSANTILKFGSTTKLNGNTLIAVPGLSMLPFRAQTSSIFTISDASSSQTTFLPISNAAMRQYHLGTLEQIYTAPQIQSRITQMARLSDVMIPSSERTAFQRNHGMSQGYIS